MNVRALQKTCLALFASAALAAGALRAATPDLATDSVDGGGRVLSTGGQYTLGDTVGQHDAYITSGGPYTLEGGFWASITAAGSEPAITAPVSIAVTEDTATALAGISISDTDIGAGELRVLLSVANGTLTIGTSTGLTFIQNDGVNDSIVIFTGTIANTNAALASLTYTPRANFAGAESLAIIADDLPGGGGQVGARNVALPVAAVNDAPVVTAPATVAAIDVEARPVTGIAISDVDGGADVEVTLTATSATLSVTVSPDLEFSVGDGAGDATMTFSGAPADVATALGSLTVLANAGFTGGGSITVTANDLGNTGSGGPLNGTATIGLTLGGIAPAITSGLVATGQVDVPFSYTITASGSVPMTFSATPLPAGLILIGDTISGTPLDAGVTTVTLGAANGFPPNASATLTVTISGKGLVVPEPSTELAKVGFPFRFDLVAISGVQPITYTVTGLPAGLSFNESVIAGVPTAVGDAAVTITATDATGASASTTLTISVLDKSVDYPTQVEAIAASPSEPFVGEDVEFRVEVNDPDAKQITVTWDFGDGSTGTGLFVTHGYEAEGTYAVKATATDGKVTASSELALVVSVPSPNAPDIIEVVVSEVLPEVNQAVIFSANAVDPNGDPLTFTWNFGDGTPLGSGQSVSHTFTRNGDFKVTVTALDPTGNASRAFVTPIFVTAGDAPQTINDGTVTVNPLNGLGIGIMRSTGGIVQLEIDVDALNREAFEVSTNFGEPGDQTLQGRGVADRYQSSGMFVVNTTAREASTGEIKGRARKTMPISKAELGQAVEYTTLPESQSIQVSSLKGKFMFKKNTPDVVQISASIELPEGLDLSKPQAVEMAVGNVVDKGVVTPKGDASGKMSKVKVKWPKMANGQTKTGKKQFAKISVKLSAADLDTAGFDTEGVSATPKTNALKIQTAMIVGGVPYTLDTPATLKVSKDGEAGVMSGRGGGGAFGN